jgi:hypothetical protein
MPNSCGAQMTILSLQALNSPRDDSTVATYVLGGEWRRLVHAQCALYLSAAAYINIVSCSGPMCRFVRKKRSQEGKQSKH